RSAGAAAGGANGEARPNAAVLVMRNGLPVRVPIQTGISDGTRTVVLSGLQGDEQVVTGVVSGSAEQTSTGSSIFGFGRPGGNQRPNGAPNGGAAPGGQPGQGGAPNG